MTLPARRHTRLTHGEIAWREAGEGAPLVLLHGLNGSAASWAHQFTALADRFRVVAWDAPGYGGSAPHPAPGVDAYADALAELLDALGIDACNLLGHSMGGVVAPAVAHRHPARVRRLVLSATRANYSDEPADGFAQRARLIETLTPEEFGRNRARTMLSANAPAAVLDAVAAVAAEVRREGYLAGIEVLSRADNREVLAGLDLPVLVIGGGDDRIAPPVRLEEIARLVKSARLERIDDVAHAAYAEAAQRYNALLLDFLV